MFIGEILVVENNTAEAKFAKEVCNKSYMTL
jgi:hypothetical protein